MRHKAPSDWEIFSAGTMPKGLNPLSVAAMKEIGTDISQHTSKDVEQFSHQKFHVVITVCDNARQECPVFPAARMIHWNLMDPEDLESFRRIRDELTERIDRLLIELSR